MYIDLWPDGCECLPDVMDVIELDGLCPVFFSAADCSGSELWNNSLVFRKGRAYLVEAASGKGKSSFCSFVCGIRHDYTGHVLFDGRDIRTFAQTEWRDMRRSSFGMMFQDLELFPELTVAENLDIKNRLTGYYSFSEMEDLLCRLGLSGKSGQKVSTLSLGERQRVAFIRTLAQPLDFLLMDEPVSHLDVFNAEIMASVVAEEMDKRGCGVIVTSLGHALPLEYDRRIRL